MDFEEYAHRFETVRFERRDGILQMQLHSDGGPLILDATVHRELGPAFRAVADDTENRVVIITGTGESFWAGADMTSFHHFLGTPKGWDRIGFEGRQMLTALLDIDVPIIAAVNGPALVHAEIPLLADIVIASDTAEFGDFVHITRNVLPGDGVHVVWPRVLGFNRGRYLLLTGQKLGAQEALDQGLIGEVHPLDRLVPRAWQLAEELNEKPLLLLRQVGATLRGELRRAMLQDLGHGLAIEGLAALGGQDGLGAGAEGDPVPTAERIVHDFVSGEVGPRYPQ